MWLSHSRTRVNERRKWSKAKYNKIIFHKWIIFPVASYTSLTKFVILNTRYKEVFFIFIVVFPCRFSYSALVKLLEDSHLSIHI